jgi:hypothetical protein
VLVVSSVESGVASTPVAQGLYAPHEGMRSLRRSELIVVGTECATTVDAVLASYHDRCRVSHIFVVLMAGAS